MQKTGRVILLVCICTFAGQALTAGDRPIVWAQRVVNYTMQTYTPSQLEGEWGWSYWCGFYLLGQYRVYKETGQSAYLQYIKDWVDLHVDSNGNLDCPINGLNPVEPGYVTLMLYAETEIAKYGLAAEKIRNALSTYPRTSDNCFSMDDNPEGWDQLWLDGAYMALPFYAKYGQVTGDTACITDAADQLIRYAVHLQDACGLLYHAYDEDASRFWADPVTHHSPIFWGRAMGWFSMALVEILDCMPDDHPKRPALIAILAALVEGLAAEQDPVTGLWYQVVDQGGRDGNWLESSCSCMFSYAVCRAVARGYVPDAYLSTAVLAYEGILQNRIIYYPGGPIHLTQISAGVIADSSYAYYVNVAKHEDDLHGLGAFLMMCWEMEKVNGPPSVRILSPADPSHLSPNTDVTITVNATDVDGDVVRVDFYEGSDLLYSDDASPWEFHWGRPAPGSYVLTAVAVDNENDSSASDPVRVFVTDNAVLVEAETGTVSPGTVDTDIAGYTGTGFVNPANQIGSYLELSFVLPRSGTWNMTTRYTNGSVNNRPCTIQVDGGTVRESFDFPSTGAWADWAYSDPIGLDLASGSHILRLTGLTSEGGPDFDHVKWLDPENLIYMKLKVRLEGPGQPAGGMFTALNAAGSIPIASPYADHRSAVRIPAGVTDWVSVELRSLASGPASVQRSFFLRKDGAVTDTNGATTGLLVPGADAGDYFIVVRHRNHLAVMSASARFLHSGSPDPYDFTDAPGRCYGLAGEKDLEAGVWGMWAGDVNQDGNVTTMDYTSWYNSARLGESGYRGTDMDMDGFVTTSDYTIWYNNARLGAASGVP
ncbi:glycoside hydrolase family 88 protein [bacterium]|nr:glycoside hydrolase family 88 protein [bacterium]